MLDQSVCWWVQAPVPREYRRRAAIVKIDHGISISAQVEAALKMYYDSMDKSRPRKAQEAQRD